MIGIYRMFAHYNQWANNRVYDAVSRLNDADYRADYGAFFRSLHGTLNHLLVTDYAWMHRFTGEGPGPQALDTILHDAFLDLRVAREAEDARIIRYVDGLNDTDLTGVISYVPITVPTRITQPLGPTLSHFFNHQTHHRGQAHALLTRIAGEAPSIDLAPFQRQTGIGMT